MLAYEQLEMWLRDHRDVLLREAERERLLRKTPVQEATEPRPTLSWLLSLEEPRA
jgi:hypothetical protein